MYSLKNISYHNHGEQNHVFYKSLFGGETYLKCILSHNNMQIIIKTCKILFYLALYTVKGLGIANVSLTGNKKQK